jgi:hypothetical protein
MKEKQHLALSQKINIQNKFAFKILHCVDSIWVCLILTWSHGLYVRDDLCHIYMQFINASHQTSLSPKAFQSTLAMKLAAAGFVRWACKLKKSSSVSAFEYSLEFMVAHGWCLKHNQIIKNATRLFEYAADRRIIQKCCSHKRPALRYESQLATNLFV